MLVLLLTATSRSSTAEIARDDRRSGSSFMATETRAMQDDATANPGMLWVLDGEKLWKAKAEASDQTSKMTGKSCADCHGDV
ncbi:MAG: sulfur oxidation c-type cytochrome SoxA, partial [Hyphomicrobiales bacterium]|nr:sulfur oxidation c-type cytochrome SoxA [Hyphomicrobiales bacterium]